jgi:RNA 3'-terminal phosphate cyclase (ATP)
MAGSSDWITIDGSQGEGGGQILRTSLALSMITGKAVHFERIRANRSKPGLQRQHLTAVLAAARVCKAKVDGAHLHSADLWFKPGPIKPGPYEIDIGSAGSTTLVLQTILPALLTADEPSQIQIVGGTHNPNAPPVDFLQHSFLGVLRRHMQADVELTLDRYGFYPRGGGKISVRVEPKPLAKMSLVQRGSVHRCRAIAVVSGGLPRSIAERELSVVKQRLDWQDERLRVEELPSEFGPGNFITLHVEGEHVHEVFVGFGQRGVRAEDVAAQAVRQAEPYLASDVPVGEHLADQLLLPMALAGAGSFATLPLSSHAETNILTIQRFINVGFAVEPFGDGGVQVTASRSD